MMKKLLLVALACMLALPCLTPALADSGTQYVSTYEPVLSSLTNNCPNTGVMLPETFDPHTTSYILTVASWVTRVTFTPTCIDPNATIRVNGTAIRSGSTTSYFKMTDEPQQVTIIVSNLYGESTTYTIFLQRRPSDRRTRVSSGYISDIYQKVSTWYISADLVTVNYSSGNMSTFSNSSTYLYKYACDENCIYYYGTMNNPIRAYDIADFYNNYLNYGSNLYRLVYIEDKIVAVMPYDAD